MSDHLMPTYARLPVRFVRGQGPWLWDESGRRYLDALSGIAVCALGHAHPAVAQALADQAATLVHTSNLYQLPLQERLAEALCALSGADRVFFCNSGAEANEAAIKLARRHGHARGLERPQIAVMDGAFHGRTLATLAATGNPRIKAGFEPLPEGFVRVPYGDAAALAALPDSAQVCAVLLEPIQGEGGVRVPPEGYLAEVERVCRARGWLLMFDEIQTGLGRTGAWFAHQHERVRPDVMTLAKSLGNGVPIGACLAWGEAAEVLGPGSHGSTFGGNPLAARAGLTVLEVMRAENAPERAARLGAALRQALAEALGGRPEVRAIRGRGLMIGVELDRPCAGVVTEALAQGLLLNVTAERVVRLLPPLLLEDAQVAEIAAGTARAIAAFLDAGA